MRKVTNVMIAFLFAVVFISEGTQMAHAQGSQGAPSGTNNNKAASADSCSLLTAGTIAKVLGQSLQGNPKARKAPPMYGGAWGSSCVYIVAYENHEAMRIELTVYTEASSAKAKQDFDTYALTADYSKGKPAIGDSAYWVISNRALDSNSLALFVLKGNAHFSIKMTPTNEKQLKDLAAAVAAGI